MNKTIEYIEFQTVSYCNAQCVVCPWADIKADTKLEFISEDIWNRVVD